MSAPEEDSPVSEVAVHDEPQVALIEVEPGLAVVFGDNLYTAAAGAGKADSNNRDCFSNRLQGHLRELEADVSSRRTYIQKNAEEIIADAHGVLMAEGAWHRYRVLRAAHISNEQEN